MKPARELCPICDGPPKYPRDRRLTYVVCERCLRGIVGRAFEAVSAQADGMRARLAEVERERMPRSPAPDGNETSRARSPAWPDAEELQRRIDRSDPGTGLTRGRRRA